MVGGVVRGIGEREVEWRVEGLREKLTGALIAMKSERNSGR
jgi:hypothetical protein